MSVNEHSFISLEKVRSRLAALWFIVGFLIILILVFQSLFGYYEDKVQDVWGWVQPTLTPTLGMIVAVSSYTALDPRTLESVFRRSFFILSFWLSALYLALVMLTMLVQPFVGGGIVIWLQLMRLSNLWLGPIQGSVASVLGALFVSKRKPGE